MFQWLTVSSRPLRVEEVAEVISFDFNAETSGIPKFDPRRRESNSEKAVRLACSTLVNIINIRGAKVVQFSHASVREYLMSDRIAKAILPDFFRVPPVPALSYNFQVLLQQAHALLAKASLSVLLQLDSNIDESKLKDFPLAEYAAEHWVGHAQSGNALSEIQGGMDRLFDETHLAAWLWVYNVDLPSDERPDHPGKPNAVPLYYAAGHGLYDLAVRLLDARPKDVGAEGGVFGTPLFSALRNQRLDIVRLLLERGADAQSLDPKGISTLYFTSYDGRGDILKVLIEGGADPNAECVDFFDSCSLLWTPLLVASKHGKLEAAKALLLKKADVKFQDREGTSSLHLAASRHSSDGLVKLLLDYGAIPNMTNNRRRTALHDASFYGQLKVVELLLKGGADIHAEDEFGYTPLHEAAGVGQVEIVRLLLACGAKRTAQKSDGLTALDLAEARGHHKVVEVLREHDSNVHALGRMGDAPF
jgi:ankyrin repeat protein